MFMCRNPDVFLSFFTQLRASLSYRYLCQFLCLSDARPPNSCKAFRLLLGNLSSARDASWCVLLVSIVIASSIALCLMVNFLRSFFHHTRLLVLEQCKFYIPNIHQQYHLAFIANKLLETWRRVPSKPQMMFES
jgi:hypothetical protein